MFEMEWWLTITVTLFCYYKSNTKYNGIFFPNHKIHWSLVRPSGLMYHNLRCASAVHCRALQLLLQSNLFLWRHREPGLPGPCQPRSELIMRNIQLFWLSSCDCLINIIELHRSCMSDTLTFCPACRLQDQTETSDIVLRRREGIELGCTHAVCTQYKAGQTVTPRGQASCSRIAFNCCQYETGQG